MSTRRTYRWILAALLIFPAGGCSPPGGVYHTVEKGQTLYQISRIYDLAPGELARVNGIDDPTRLQVGTRLFIPGTTVPREVPASRRTVPSSPPSGPSPPPAQRSVDPQPAKAAVQTARPPASAPTFIWPLQGKVLRPFSTGGSSPSKGVEIAASPGAEIRAAAAGQVIYSGDGITSFGNLIIIKHAGGFFSVYGYNRENLARTGSFVGQGDRIALAGTPPGKEKARLYFEIRNGKDAVDPIFYLP